MTRKTQDFPNFAGFAYQQYELELRRYLLRRLRNREDVRDISQEVWTRLLRVNQPERLVRPLGYVIRTAANVLAEFRLRERRDPVAFDSDALADAGQHPLEARLDDLADRMSTEDQLQRLLARLPATYRKILLLRLCEGLGYQEIAKKLGLTRATTEKYFFRAMNVLRSTPRE